MEQKVPLKPLALKYGAILGVASFAYSMVMQMTGQALSENSASNWGGSLITVLIIVFALREYRNINEGYMTFKQGLGCGMAVALVGGLIGGLANTVYILIDKSFVEALLEKQQEILMETPGMTEDAMEMSMNMMEIAMSPPVFFLLAVLGSLLTGLVVSLIASLFMRKDPPADMTLD